MLTLNKDILHIDWPFGVKENITITEDNQVFTSFVFPYYSQQINCETRFPFNVPRLYRAGFRNKALSHGANFQLKIPLSPTRS